MVTGSDPQLWPENQASGSFTDAAVIPVIVDLPEPYRTMARYAIASLVEPYSLVPDWVEELADAGSPVLYYGPHEEAPSGAIRLPYDPNAYEAIANGASLDASAKAWREWDGIRWPVLFADPLVDEPDLVAGAFYLLAGCQETGGGPRDRHGRILFENSLQDRLDLADRPVVDAYREWFAERLRGAGLDVSLRHWGDQDWAFCPTIDVDYLWKWRKGMVYREAVRNLILNDRQVGMAGRARRFWDFLVDAAKPGDVYRSALERIIDEVRARDGTATIFLKTGAHGANDVGYSVRGSWLRGVLTRARRTGFEIGLHPSYYAHTHGRYLAEEIQALHSVFGRAPRSVRQHYLRYERDRTLRLHESFGFEIDSTLGFADHEGFRRGTAFPFRLFDLDDNRPTNVWEMPLIVMDGALFNRCGYTVSEATEVTHRLLDTCKSFGGCAVMLWHNILWDEMDAPGWGRHFVDTLDYAFSQGALIADLHSALRSWRSVRA